MGPHREESQRAPPPGAEPKPKRFRIVKLEERIAPGAHGNGSNGPHCVTRAGPGCPGSNGCTFEYPPCGYCY